MASPSTQWTVTIGGTTYRWDPAEGRDLARAESFGGGEPVAFDLPPPRLEWLSGSIDSGAPARFRCATVHGLNPHAATHIEGPGHIGGEPATISPLLDRHHFAARLVTVPPATTAQGDRVVTEEAVAERVADSLDFMEAVVLRALPREAAPPASFSGSNPPYLAAGAARWLRLRGTRILLVDLPSLDREQDGGKLDAHRAFLGAGGDPAPRAVCELLRIPADLEDGRYILNLVPLAWELDACPVRPILYPIR